MSQIQIIIGVWFVVAMVILVSIWFILRDMLTRAYYAKKSLNHMVVEFLSQVGKVFVELIKIDDLSTGQFTYKDRVYFARKERYLIDYPPGRSSMAQVTFTKCYADPASADMATCIHGKPTVDSSLVGSAMQQQDTAHAMDVSREDSNGGKSGSKKQFWTWIALGILGVIGGATLVFIIKGQGVQDSILIELQKIATALLGAE